MIIQSPAIVLAIRPWSQTSHMVTWLTPGYGKIVTPVKGACRPRSAFLGQYDLFYTCDLLFYRRDRDGVHAIRECRPTAMREGLRHRWRQATLAGYLADLTASVALPHQAATEVFELLSDAFDALAAARPANLPRLMLGYEISLLELLGVRPDLAICPECHADDGKWLRFSLASGRFCCRHHSDAQASDSTITLHRAVRERYLHLAQTIDATGLAESRAIVATEKNRNLILGLSRFLGMFMFFHLEVPPAARRVTWEMLETDSAPQPAL